MDAPARWSSVVVDVDAGRVTAEGVDGRWSGPCRVLLPRGAVVRAQWTPASAELVLTTRRGTEIGFDLPGSRGVDGRPVVYLDQNVWSALSRATHRPDRLPPAVLDVARRLTRLAEARLAVLPLSSSHMLETTRWPDDADRVALAETMLRLSRGWCIRHPLRVRALEMRLLLGLDVPAGPVVGPGFWPLEAHGRDAVDGPAAVAAAVVLAETFLDPDPVPRPEDLPWAEARQAFAATLPAKSRRHLRYDLVAGHVWQDLFPDLAEAAFLGGMSVGDTAEWVAGHWSDGFARLRATGLFAGMMAERLVNPGSTWRPNDLTDMAALSTAAGYVGHVVTERHMGSVLGRVVDRLGRPVTVSAGLVAGVASVEAALAGAAETGGRPGRRTKMASRSEAGRDDARGCP